jgi:hypothetical protein
MPNVIYSMGGVAADGYVVGPDVDLELFETRTFSSRVVYLRYRAAG